MKGKALLAIIGSKKPSFEKEEEAPEMGEDSEESESSDGVSAAEDILAAVKSGSAEDLDEALRAHYKLCSHSKKKSSKEDDEDYDDDDDVA